MPLSGIAQHIHTSLFFNGLGHREAARFHQAPVLAEPLPHYGRSMASGDFQTERSVPVIIVAAWRIRNLFLLCILNLFNDLLLFGSISCCAALASDLG